MIWKINVFARGDIILAKNNNVINHFRTKILCVECACENSIARNILYE